MSKYIIYAKELVKKLTLPEKVAQLSQKVAGYRCFNRNGEEFEFNDEFKSFISNYGAMGAISNILRACGFTKKNWGIGIEPQHRAKVANQLQKYVLEHSRVPIPVLIEVEANHGLQALGSELFPTNIGIGCTFNTELYYRIMKSVGKEIRLSGNHMAFVTMFDVARDPRWGRVEECYSEDPYLVSCFTKKGVEGIKSENALVCCKHYCATGDGFGGLNAAEVNIGNRELHDIYLPAVETAVESGADVIMAAYNAVDGIPCHANRHLLREVLRDELGFDGVVLSDGFAVSRMIEQMGMDMIHGSAHALKAGVDISLADTDGAYLNIIEACEKGIIKEELIDEAVVRVLEKKYQMNLFDNPYIEENGDLVAYLDSGEQKRLSYEAAAESVVLLKNNGILPITPDKKVALIGVHANNIYYQLGDYTSYRKPGEGKTIKQAFKEKIKNVTYTKGWSFYDEDTDFQNALKIAGESDVIVLTLGGSSARLTSEVIYDKNTGAALETKRYLDCGEGIDIAKIKLPGNQMRLFRMLKETDKPIIALLIQGRPYEITEIDEQADAVLAAWYPGQQGGEAIADILTGVVNPSGKLSVSIPYSSACLPAYYNRIGEDAVIVGRTSANTYKDFPRRILYPFGYGLSYSEFKYSNIMVKKLADNKYEISADVENVSDIAGKEVTQMYIRGYGNSIRRRGKELKGFRKIFLQPQEKKTVTFSLGYNELKVFSADNKWEIEDGRVEIFIGSNPNLPLMAEIYTTASKRLISEGENFIAWCKE